MPRIGTSQAVAQTHGTRKMHALVYGSVHCFAAYSAKSGRAALCATAYGTIDYRSQELLSESRTFEREPRWLVYL